ncbi:uncharacterized protein TRIADDRAFT_22769 [Trichoplax adhaerens]|uniref:Transmembrane protein 234 n=1 Tax=Trichoplax adhaerens TaxID=10228 RepID=B3RRL6_TRIAD|nr:hypothetical protein TRIADDRAFT_22769 [Trichoplax adhaerens]EDV26370.1 hypothetical protein TRIADDRAFT_22769 [Trichoplax adhaerens]|eukprot:XP_002110366.1 hypothetical protein TRIADDRAFT_22769 [Trichoplax adhaerens]
MPLNDIIECTISFIVVSLFWGCTNPLIKKANDNPHQAKLDKGSNRLFNFYLDFKNLVTNWKRFYPILINQIGSLIYYVTLSKADLSLAIPVANSLTFVFTALTGYYLGEKLNGGIRLWLGTSLILCGVTLCVISKT